MPLKTCLNLNQNNFVSQIFQFDSFKSRITCENSEYKCKYVVSMQSDESSYTDNNSEFTKSFTLNGFYIFHKQHLRQANDCIYQDRHVRCL